MGGLAQSRGAASPRPPSQPLSLSRPSSRYKYANGYANNPFANNTCTNSAGTNSTHTNNPFANINTAYAYPYNNPYLNNAYSNNAYPNNSNSGSASDGNYTYAHPITDVNLAPPAGPTIAFAVPSGGPSWVPSNASTSLPPDPAPAGSGPPGCSDSLTGFEMPRSRAASCAPSTSSESSSVTSLNIVTTPTSTVWDQIEMGPYPPTLRSTSLRYPDTQPIMQPNGQIQGSFTLGSRANVRSGAPEIELMPLEQVHSVHSDLLNELRSPGDFPDNSAAGSPESSPVIKLDDPSPGVSVECQSVASANPLPPEATTSISELVDRSRSNNENSSGVCQGTFSATPLPVIARNGHTLHALGYSPSMIRDSWSTALPPPKLHQDSISPERLANWLDKVLAFGMSCEDLVDYFFDSLLPHCPIILRADFNNSFERLKQAQRTRSNVSARTTCLVVRVLACATQEKDMRKSNKLLEHARLFENVGDISIPALQSLLLEAFWMKREGRLAECRQSLKLAFMVAIELGIHQVDHLGLSDPGDVERRKWIWLTMVVWDWEIAEFLGQPRIITGAKCAVSDPKMTILTSGVECDYMLGAYFLQKRIGVGRYHYDHVAKVVDGWQNGCVYDLSDNIAYDSGDDKSQWAFARKYLQIIQLMALLEHLRNESEEFIPDLYQVRTGHMRSLVGKLMWLIKLVDERAERMLFLLHYLFSSAIMLITDVGRLDAPSRRVVFSQVRTARDLLLEKYIQDSQRLAWVKDLSDVLTRLIERQEQLFGPVVDEREVEGGGAVEEPIEDSGLKLDGTMALIDVNKVDEGKERGKEKRKAKAKGKEKANESEEHVGGGESSRPAKRRATRTESVN